MPAEKSFLDKMFDHADSLVGVLEKGKELSDDRSEDYDEEDDKKSEIIDAEFVDTPAPKEAKGVVKAGERIEHLRVDFFTAFATMRSEEEKKQLRDLIEECKRLVG